MTPFAGLDRQLRSIAACSPLPFPWRMLCVPPTTHHVSVSCRIRTTSSVPVSTPVIVVAALLSFVPSVSSIYGEYSASSPITSDHRTAKQPPLRAGPGCFIRSHPPTLGGYSGYGYFSVLARLQTHVPFRECGGYDRHDTTNKPSFIVLPATFMSPWLVLWG